MEPPPGAPAGTPLRIVFMGTPELAAESLRALLASPAFQIVAVATQQDQPKGRGLKLQASPVKQIALDKGLPVFQPDRVRGNDGFLRELTLLRPDLIVVAAYGQILPKNLLELPPHGCLNVHTSLLPKYRGAAPIQWAILSGDSETGITLMKIDAGLDTGPIVAQARTPIDPDDNSQTLHARLAQLGARLLVETLPAYAAGAIQPRPQPADGVCLAPKIRKQDGRIDWNQPARAVWNRVRAMVPWPGAHTQLAASPQPSVLKLWAGEPAPQSGPPGQVLSASRDGIVVGCGSESFRILELQREGGRRMAARDFLAGHPLQPGQVLV
jgi:methionyl-tRNA formyltransferase